MPERYNWIHSANYLKLASSELLFEQKSLLGQFKYINPTVGSIFHNLWTSVQIPNLK